MRADLLENANNMYGPQCASIAQAWLTTIDNLTGADPSYQLDAVNHFLNDNLYYATDDQVWGIDDYWATPFETFSKVAGNCKDFAIAKYVTLRMLGMPEDSLHLIYCQIFFQGVNQAHMVLGSTLNSADPLILDNVNQTIFPLSQRTDITPLFSFNTHQLIVNNTITPYDPRQRMSKWENLLEKLSREGINL